MTEFCIAYSTAPDQKVAETIAKALVEHKLAACVNIINNMKSIYFWKNNLQADNEVILIIKTQHKLVAKLEEKLQEIHPYECPCLIYLPILGGSSAYLDWLKAETSS